MTLAIEILNHIFHLHANTQDYHLKCPNVLGKCHNINNFSL